MKTRIQRLKKIIETLQKQVVRIIDQLSINKFNIYNKKTKKQIRDKNLAISLSSIYFINLFAFRRRKKRKL